MPKWVGEFAEAIAPKHVLERLSFFCTRLKCLLKRCIDILQIQKDAARAAVQRLWRLCFAPGRFIGKHDVRIPNQDLRMHDLAIWSWHSEKFFRTEGLFIEVNGF